MLIEPIRRADAKRALLRALLPLMEPATLLSARTTDWASATFEGERHELAFLLAGADGAARGRELAAGLPERAFELRNHVVADIAAALSSTELGTVLTVEALTIADA